MFAVFKKELQAYFHNVTGFIFMGFFLLITGFFFTTMNLLQSSPEYNGVLGTITFTFLIVVPILTMRLLSEESRQKTDQLLFTSPVGISGIVLGKYLAALCVFLMTLMVTFVYPVLISFVGRIATAQVASGYVGMFLLGASFIALGLFVSSLTDNQVIAAVVTFAVLLFVWILDWIQQAIPSDALSGLVFAALLVAGFTAFVFLTVRNIIVTISTGVIGAAVIVIVYLTNSSGYQGFIVNFLKWFSLLKRYGDFNMGVLSLSPIIYYISFCFAFIFLTIRVIEKRRWK